MHKTALLKQINKYWEKLFADPITVNTPRPIASNFKNTFQCFLRWEYKKKITIPVTTVIPIYAGSEIEFGGNLPRTTSRMVPPATPVIVARIIIPTMSALCSIALKAPVTANDIVTKRSKM